MKSTKFFLSSFVLLVLVLVFSLPANATITSTETSAGMRTTVDSTGANIIDTAAGTTTASVNATDPISGVTSYANLDINYLNNEEANLFFNLGFNNYAYPSGGYIGQSKFPFLDFPSNYFRIFYYAEIDSLMTYSWNFDYTGENPWGLSTIRITEGDDYRNYIREALGNDNAIGHHEGQDTYNLLAGNNYEFTIYFNPNLGLGVGGSMHAGELTGDISMNFNGASVVPEPVSSTLFIVGGATLGFRRFRKKYRK
jgi:hypothetical protein